MGSTRAVIVRLMAVLAAAEGIALAAETVATVPQDPRQRAIAKRTRERRRERCSRHAVQGGSWADLVPNPLGGAGARR